MHYRSIHRYILFLLVLILSLSFTGCRKKTDQQMTNTTTESTSAAKDSSDSTPSTELNSTSEDDSKEVAESHDTKSDSITSENISVSNNGGEFVKVGSKVYYTQIPYDSMERTVLFGEFRNNLRGKTSCSLMCYDEQSKRSDKIADIPSCTRLCYYNNHIYFTSLDEFYDHKMYDIDLDSRNVNPFASGNMIFTDSETGRYVTTGGFSTDELHVYEGSNEVASISTPDENLIYDSLMLQGDHMVYSLSKTGETTKASNLDRTVHVYNIKDKTDINLGKIPYDSTDYYDYLQINQCYIKNDILYFYVGYYAGTAHCLNEGFIYTADISRENSIKKSIDVDFSQYPSCPERFLESAVPEIVFIDEMPFRVSANTDNSFLEVKIPTQDGKNLKTKKVARLSMPDLVKENDEILYETMEYIDDSIYMIVNEANYNANASVGWRDAYTLDVIHYYRVDEKTGTITSIDSPTVLPEIKQPVSYRITNPGDSHYCCDEMTGTPSESINMKQISKSANTIIDQDDWFSETDLWSLKESYTGQFRYSLSESYDTETHSGYVLNIINKDTDDTEYMIDLSEFYNPLSLTDNYDLYWRADYRFAYSENDIVYISMAHPTYAESNPHTAFIIAVRLTDGKLLWKTENLVSNSRNFAVIDNVIVSGYGFTNEPDYLYQICKKTGTILEQIPVKTAPDYIFYKDNNVYVRTYDTDYVYSVEK